MYTLRTTLAQTVAAKLGNKQFHGVESRVKRNLTLKISSVKFDACSDYLLTLCNIRGHSEDFE